MGKYFGTDGVRGRANEGLTLDMSIRIGQYLGWYYSKDKHARILVGKDTRLSGDMFELGLAAGATSMGAQVYLLGVCPTPSISYLIQKNVSIVESWSVPATIHTMIMELKSLTIMGKRWKKNFY